MKKFENTIKKEDAVISTRKIDPHEWDKFNERMEEVNEKCRHKSIFYHKSAQNVFVRVNYNTQENYQNNSLNE